MTGIAFIRPGDDAAAADLGAWGEQVRAIAAASGWANTVDHAGPANTTRAEIDGLLTSAPPDHLLWFGHGRDDALIATSTAVIDTTNVGYLSGGVLVAIACDAARNLGPVCVQTYGVRAFLGFDDHLGWPARAPGPTESAFVEGLACLFKDRHDVDCSSTQLRHHFAMARDEYEHNGHTYGLTDGDSQTAWLFAKSNGGSVRVYGDYSATLE